MTQSTRPGAAWLYGVVAGLSARFGWQPGWTRVAVLGLLYFAPMKTLIAYLIALWLMPKSWRGY
ncbi:PspC domain-containing protein [uncultured Ferrimonas sp.]|uniref:PspC domain-containing protein n=1 Tax=uncultured Ferrimonas sp. TaxID=432640 RepID=UPI002614D2BF|nr:PspC domain-containing protein [uncultured Ferrimonas sp.]